MLENECLGVLISGCPFKGSTILCLDQYPGRGRLNANQFTILFPSVSQGNCVTIVRTIRTTEFPCLYVLYYRKNEIMTTSQLSIELGTGRLRGWRGLKSGTQLILRMYLQVSTHSATLWNCEGPTVEEQE